ncbi:MAG: transglycosylase SLT domain-containing protein [Treponema sp.]|nr:transglycosylase SLT domain-containing protein [Treponema sp.]
MKIKNPLILIGTAFVFSLPLFAKKSSMEKEIHLTREETILLIREDFGRKKAAFRTMEIRVLKKCSGDFSQENIPEGNIILPEKTHVTIEIDGFNHELTDRFRRQFMTNSGQKILTASLYDSIPYRPYIKKLLKEHDMPMFLQYLPVIESNYKTRAVSKSGAKGLWQFMTNSMHPFLKMNTWYDERLDPWKETEAAIKKLKDNYMMFHSWPEALAAYNMGAGALKRVMKQHPGKNYWALSESNLIPAQTAYYVPKLLAVADLVENAEYYGLIEVSLADKMIEDAEVPEYEYVQVAGMISLEQISSLSGIERQTMDFLNPALLRKCTPAGEKYMLRVPGGKTENVKEALEKANVASDAVVHNVKQGDSLWAISRMYEISVEDLCSANGINRNGILSINQKIIIPVFK